MKHMQMLLLVSLLLALGLTACGGDSRNSSTGNDGIMAGDSAGMQNGVNGSGSTNGSVNGSGSTNGSVNGNSGSTGNGYNDAAGNNNPAGVMPEDSLVDDARDALDDAGNAAGRAMDGF